MGRPRKNPPKVPADPAHISEVRRAAALASAKARAAKSIHKGRRPRSVSIRADVFDRLDDYANETNQTRLAAATEVVDYGLAHIPRKN